VADTHIKHLRDELTRTIETLKGFEEFRSPVNHEAVVAMWSAKRADQNVRVAIFEEHGVFYRGRIEGVSKGGGWDILADDGELVTTVAAASFVAVRVEYKP
jgi:hypothetical protein